MSQLDNLETKLLEFRESDNSRDPRVLAMLQARVVWAAICNKYSGFDETDVCSVMSDEPIERTDKDAIADIQRQARVLSSIETIWRFKDVDFEAFVSIYRSIYGLGENSSPWRETELVLEDGFKVPTAPERIGIEGISIERILGDANEAVGVRLDLQIDLAVRLFATIIRVHPFPDGNGRMARTMVNLYFRKWFLPYIAVPKVRNDAIWRDALHVAMDGERRLANKFFRQLLDESLEAVSSLS